MDPVESPLLDDEAMAILNTGYLLRPPTRQALLAALSDAPERFDETLEALIAGGFIRADGDRLEYVSPYSTFIALGRMRATRMYEETFRTAAMMQALPQLIRAWDLSEVDEEEGHPLSVNIIHAKADSWDEWFRHVAAEPPNRPSAVFTETAVLRVALASGHLALLQSQLVDTPHHVRALLSAGLETDADLVREARELGVEFRTSHRVTSWMYVDDPGLVGLPIMWRAGTPTSALAIRTPPIVSAVAMLFDELWASGEPFVDEPETWAPILHMLSQGLTDDAIARALGLTTRTVRRRIAEAMVEFDAASRFTLGVAWQSRRSR